MRLFLAGLLLCLSMAVSAQNLSKTGFNQLKKMEDSMKVYGRKMIMEKTASQRFIADSIFIRMLVRSLKTPNSFNYPFDSLVTVSHIYAPDSTFRIFTWQFTRDEDSYRQRGAIQVKTPDGSLQLFPLIDMSDFTNAPQDSVRTGQNWIGAIYYGIVMKIFNGKKYYTLLGFDDNHMRSTKKWIEVLTFNGQGKPVFGGSYFPAVSDSVRASALPARFCLEYKKAGNARMNYDKDMDMIVYDHLVSESNEPNKVYTMVPDGDYQGFKWSNGKWLPVDKVFNYSLRDGQAPLPDPLKDAGGKSDELKLMQQSEKNRQKQKPLQSQPKLPVKNSSGKNPAKEGQESY
jgi:hypothetical protein